MSPLSTFIPAAAAACLTLWTFAASVQAQTVSDENSTVDGLAMGEPIDDTPQPGDTYVKEEFGDWILRCIVDPEAEDPCQMYQLLSDQQGSPIAEFTMFRLPEASEAVGAATIVVPLETSLQRGLRIRVDENPGKAYPFSFCNTIGCYSRIGLTAEDVASYKAGGEAQLVIVPIAAPDQSVITTLSLDGFTAAFEAASVLQE